MLTRWLTTFIVSISLLFAATGAAVVCAAPMPMDCCPDHPAPGKQTDSSSLCCMSVPAIGATVVLASRPHLGAVDDIPAALLSTTLHLPARPHAQARAGPAPPSAHDWPDCSLTYLRTARLRI
ncbi:MAG: hypothetical protein ABIT36_07340 [Steroidobacteraceae bacterium]